MCEKVLKPAPPFEGIFVLVHAINYFGASGSEPVRLIGNRVQITG
jgi:hypothetical protein